MDFTRGDSRRFQRTIPSISLAFCLENIHEVSPPGDLRLECSKLAFFCFADFFFADRFEDEIDFARRDFRFSTGEEDVRGSSYRRFSSELLLFV